MTYSIINSEGQIVGRFTGESPSRAAKKAAKEIHRETGRTKFNVNLIDNQSKRQYRYQAQVQVLNPPRKIKIGNSVFLEKYDISLIKLGQS